MRTGAFVAGGAGGGGGSGNPPTTPPAIPPGTPPSTPPGTPSSRYSAPSGSGSIVLGASTGATKSLVDGAGCACATGLEAGGRCIGGGGGAGGGGGGVTNAIIVGISGICSATKSAGNTRIAVTANACAVVDMKIGSDA